MLVTARSPHHATVGSDCDRVVLTIDGRTLVIPWEHADAIARAMTAKVREAEAWAKREQTSRDQAVLLRTGAPIGLSNDPDVQSEALRHAMHDRDLRRYLPGGIRSRGHVGRPSLVRHPPDTAKE